jgi:glucosamine--fructose-6-phosphate aminotransferase (isomerizing)
MMCGIFGCILKNGDVAPIIHVALKRLEYRGYDSVGEVTIHENKLFMKKDQGKIDDVHIQHDLDDLPGRVGLGHTRWATHGAPFQMNAHPHVDCAGQIAVVHNGIIENFGELRRELEELGHVFRSKTDSEVIPHLIEEKLKGGLTMLEAVREAVSRLRVRMQSLLFRLRSLTKCFAPEEIVHSWLVSLRTLPTALLTYLLFFH